MTRLVFDNNDLSRFVSEYVRDDGFEATLCLVNAACLTAGLRRFQLTL